MRSRAGVIALFLSLLVCNCQKKRLQAQLTVLEQERASLSQRVEERRNRVRDTAQHLESLNSELATYNTNVHAFIVAHRVTAGCIQASRSTWGENNSFSRDVSMSTRLGAALCSVALLNAQFAAEVARVAEQLSEADAHVRQLKEQIAATERELASDRTELDRNEASAREIGAEIADVQQQMDR